MANKDFMTEFHQSVFPMQYIIYIYIVRLQPSSYIIVSKYDYS